MMPMRLRGLIAAGFTPLHADGSLDLDRVGPVVEHLLDDGVAGIYAVGSTGEGVSLTTAERQEVAAAYVSAVGGRSPVVIQVGHNSLAEARCLAAHAQAIGASAISATPPAYFKPETLAALVDCLAEITAAAPDLPFYYYHVPSKTGVNLDMVELLEAAGRRLPTLVGIKFTTPPLHEFQACLAVEDGHFDLLWGVDEMVLAAWSVGARGAVGSSYNFATPLYLRMIHAFENGQRDEAARCQALGVAMFRTIFRFPGGLPPQKAVMRLIGQDCGPTRLPLVSLDAAQLAEMEADLTRIGFFRWGRATADEGRSPKGE
jgi:N-acetylneuraminate lyase